MNQDHQLDPASPEGVYETREITAGEVRSAVRESLSRALEHVRPPVGAHSA